MHNPPAKYVVYYHDDKSNLYCHMFNNLDLAMIFFSMCEGQTEPVLMKRP